MYANATQGTLQGGESLFMLTMLGLLIVLILLVISDLKIALATRFPNALAPEHLPPPNSYTYAPSCRAKVANSSEPIRATVKWSEVVSGAAVGN